MGLTSVFQTSLFIAWIHNDSMYVIFWWNKKYKSLTISSTHWVVCLVFQISFCIVLIHNDSMYVRFGGIRNTKT